MEEYLNEIEAFYDIAKKIGVTSAECALWQTLAYIKFRSGWIDSFNATTSEISQLCGMSSKTVARTRDSLKEKGFLEFFSGRGKVPKYHLKVIHNGQNDHIEEKANAHNAHLNGHISLLNGQNSLLNTHNDDIRRRYIDDDDKGEKNEEIISIPMTKIMKCWSENLGEFNSTKKTLVNSWIDKYSIDLICLAFEKAAINDAQSINYVRKILENWEEKKIKTIQEVAEFEKLKEKKYKKNKKTDVKTFDKKYSSISNDELEKRFVENI